MNIGQILMATGQNDVKVAGDTVAASLVKDIIAAARAEGILIQPLLSLLGLDSLTSPASLNSSNATARINLLTVRELLRGITELSQDETIGIRIGRHLSVSSFNALGHAAASSDTLWDAVQSIMKFEPIIMTVGRTEISHEEAHIRACWSMKSGDYIEVLEDIFLSCWLNLAKLLTGSSELGIELHFTHSHKKEVSVWQELLGCSILFNQSIASIKCEKSLLNLSIENPDQFLHQVMTKEAEELTSALRNSLSTTIESWLESQLENGEPEQKTLASYLNMSERTLRRNIKLENNNFKNLLRKVRIKKANYLLLKTSLSLWDISSQLGYQQLTSFNAAYKRWTGETPASQRKK